MTGTCEKQPVKNDGIKGGNDQIKARKSVALLSAFYEPFMSGAEQMVKEIAERLGVKHDIVIITGRFDRKLPKKELRDNYRIIRVGFGCKRLDKFIYPVLAALKTRKFKPDIAHAVMESYAGGALVLIKYFYPKARRVLTLQSGDLDANRKQKKALIKYFWALIHKTPDYITAISNFLAGRAIKMGVPKSRVQVIPNGVDLSQVPSAGQKMEKRVICVARLSWEKGLDLLMKAWPDVVKENTGAKLVIIGDGEQRTEIEGLVKELNIQDSVEMKGRLPHNQVLAEMLKSEIFICPSLAEGLGNVFIEAQACGLPVIGTKVGGIPDIIENEINGLLIEPNNIPEISRSIIRLLSNFDLRQKLSRAAKESVKRFDWQIITEEINKIYAAPKEINLLIATGVYPPDIGGPATFAKTLGEELIKRGVNVTVLTFGDAPEKSQDIEKISRRSNVVIRYLKFFFRTLKLSKNINVLYSFDIVSTGLPCALVKLFKPRIKFICRLGGDFQWEKAVQQGKTVTLEDYYKKMVFSFRERIIYFITDFVIKKTDKLIFNSNLLKEIYCQYRKVSPLKCYVIKNIQPEAAGLPECRRDNGLVRILFAGRIIKVRNLDKLVDAFQLVKNKQWSRDVFLELVGDGPEKENLERKIFSEKLKDVSITPKISREKLLEKINASDISVLVSITEINSNFVAESLALRKPVVLTKHTEHYYNVGNKQLYFVDPFDVEDIGRGLKRAINDVISGTRYEQNQMESWGIEMVINEHMKLLYE